MLSEGRLQQISSTAQDTSIQGENIAYTRIMPQQHWFLSKQLSSSISAAEGNHNSTNKKQKNKNKNEKTTIKNKKYLQSQ